MRTATTAPSGSESGVKELLAVREIAQAFLTAEKPGDVYQFALDRVCPLVGASLACVYLRDADSDLLHLGAAHNWPERYAKFLGDMRVRVGQGPSGTAAAEQRIVEVPDVFADPALSDWQPVATELGFRSLVSLPLQTGSGVQGAVTFYFAESGKASADSRGLLRVVADQMAATAEKSRFISDLQASKSELERQYTALAEARKLQDEFLANVSHELKTPLTSVLGYLSLIDEGIAGPVTPEQRDTLSEVKSSSERLLGLIGDLLELASLKRGDLEVRITEFDAREVVGEAIAAAGSPRRGVKLVVDGPAPTIAMKSDRAKVLRLVAALVRNAFKFTEAGEVRVTAEGRGEWLIVRIADTGVGISEEAQRFVFEEFRQEDGSATRRYGGSGLGLAIARQLAHLLRGDVSLSSERGKGSTFIVDLPLVYRP